MRAGLKTIFTCALSYLDGFKRNLQHKRNVSSGKKRKVKRYLILISEGTRSCLFICFHFLINT